jgi:hypothetical protein
MAQAILAILLASAMVGHLGRPARQQCSKPGAVPGATKHRQQRANCAITSGGYAFTHVAPNHAEQLLGNVVVAACRSGFLLVALHGE